MKKNVIAMLLLCLFAGLAACGAPASTKPVTTTAPAKTAAEKKLVDVVGTTEDINEQARLGFDYAGAHFSVQDFEDGSVYIIVERTAPEDQAAALRFPDTVNGKPLWQADTEVTIAGGTEEWAEVQIPASLKKLVLQRLQVQRLFVPKTLTYIEPNYRNAYGAIEVDPKNPNYSSVDGALYNKDQTELITYPSLSQNERFAVPSTVKTIAGWAFYAVGEPLKEIVIPPSVTEMDTIIREFNGTIVVAPGSAAEKYFEEKMKVEIAWQYNIEVREMD